MTALIAVAISLRSAVRGKTADAPVLSSSRLVSYVPRGRELTPKRFCSCRTCQFVNSSLGSVSQGSVWSVMRFGQFDEHRRTINDAYDSDGRVLARQLFEAAAKHWMNRENCDGDHECLGLLQWPRRHYFTGRSPMTTLSATGCSLPVSSSDRQCARRSRDRAGGGSRFLERDRLASRSQAVTISPTSVPARAEGPSGLIKWPQALLRATWGGFSPLKPEPHFFIFKSLPLKVLTIATISPSWVS